MATKKTAKTKAPVDAAKKAPKARGAKPAKTKPEAEAKPKKLGCLDAAAKVLGETGQSMTCQAMIDAMAAKGLWSSPNGKTPAGTLCAAILREITTKAKESRFTKTERGKFALAQ